MIDVFFHLNILNLNSNPQSLFARVAITQVNKETIRITSKISRVEVRSFFVSELYETNSTGWNCEPVKAMYFILLLLAHINRVVHVILDWREATGYNKISDIQHKGLKDQGL